MKKYQNILCPIDFSSISKKTLEQALSLQKMFDAKLTVINYVEPIPASAYGMGTYDLAGDMMKQAQENMLEIKKNFELKDKEVKIENDHAKRAISHYAKDNQCDLIVIGSHGHHGFLGHLLGSTAASTVSHAPCDVFVVRNESEGAN